RRVAPWAWKIPLPRDTKPAGSVLHPRARSGRPGELSSSSHHPTQLWIIGCSAICFLVPFWFRTGEVCWYSSRLPNLICRFLCTNLKLHRKGGGLMKSSDGSRCFNRPGEVAET